MCVFFLFFSFWKYSNSAYQAWVILEIRCSVIQMRKLGFAHPLSFSSRHTQTCDPIRYLSSACACFAWECHLCPVPRLITVLSLTRLFILISFTHEPQRVDVTADNDLHGLLVFVTLSSCMTAPFQRNTVLKLYPFQDFHFGIFTSLLKPVTLLCFNHHFKCIR